MTMAKSPITTKMTKEITNVHIDTSGRIMAVKWPQRFRWSVLLFVSETEGDLHIDVHLDGWGNWNFQSASLQLTKEQIEKIKAFCRETEDAQATEEEYNSLKFDHEVACEGLARVNRNLRAAELCACCEQCERDCLDDI